MPGTSANIRCGLSDNPDVIEPGFAAIEAIAPGLQMIRAGLPNDTASLAEVWASCPDALPVLSSCMAGARFKGSLARGNREKFGVDLMPGRCGSCYKCAMEQIVLAALQGQTLPAPWAAHCVDKLRRGAQIVRGAAGLPDAGAALDLFMSDAVPWRQAIGRA